MLLSPLKHNDQFSFKTSSYLGNRAYRALLKAGGLEPSMSRPGNPYDNAAMESFNATYKRECVGLAEEQGGYATRAEAIADFFDYVEKYYNGIRDHSALMLAKISPVDENMISLFGRKDGASCLAPDDASFATIGTSKPTIKKPVS